MKEYLLSTLIICATVFSNSVIAGASNNSVPAIFVQLGGQKLIIRNPDGYIETSQNSKEIWNLANEFVTEENIILSHYITNNDFDKYKLGEQTELTEYFYIKTPKALMGSISTQEQFDTLRKSINNLNKDNILNVEALLNKFSDNYSSKEAEKNGSQFKLKVGQLIPVSINLDTENFISFTMLTQIEVADKSRLESATLVSTRGACFIKGKIIFIDYVRVLKQADDLSKSRDMVEKFSKYIMNDNQ